MAYTVGELRADIKNLPEDEEIIVVFQADNGDTREVEDGDVLDIQEVGGWNATAKARTIYVKAND